MRGSGRPYRPAWLPKRGEDEKKPSPVLTYTLTDEQQAELERKLAEKNRFKGVEKVVSSKLSVTKEIMQPLVEQGLTVPEIAEQLHLGEKTVKRLISRWKLSETDDAGITPDQAQELEKSLDEDLERVEIDPPSFVPFPIWGKPPIAPLLPLQAEPHIDLTVTDEAELAAEALRGIAHQLRGMKNRLVTVEVTVRTP